MLPRLSADQAEGLRRLFASPRPRTVAFSSGAPGSGRTTCAVNLALALASVGSRVLIIDENYGPDNVAAQLGLRPELDLYHSVCGGYAIEDVLLRGPGGVLVLPAADAARTLPALGTEGRRRAVSCFERLDRLAEIVLVDGDDGPRSAFSVAADEAVLVVTPYAASITGAYGLVKRAARDDPGRHIRILVNRCQSEQAARVAYGNLCRVAGRRLGARLDSAGTVPDDEAVRESARRRRAVMDAFPDSPAAASFAAIATAIGAWRGKAVGAPRLDTFMQRVINCGRRERTADGG